MKIRNIVILVIGILVLTQVSFGAQVRKGSMLFTGQVAIFDDEHGHFGIGGNLEYGIARSFTLGGDVCIVTGDSNKKIDDTGLLLSPSFNYHFDISDKNLDVFVGGGFFMYFYFKGDPRMDLKGFGGIRYYFSPKWAGCFRLLVGGDGFGGALGVTYRVKK